MLAVVLVVIAALVVFAVAAAVVGREARRLAAAPPRPVADPDEAVAYVAERLPDSVTAVLSYGDVRRLLAWHLEWFRRQGALPPNEVDLLAPAGDDGPPAEAVVVDESDAVAVLVARARSEGVDADEAAVGAVIDAHVDYLAFIGALRPVEDAGSDPDARPPGSPPGP